MAWFNSRTLYNKMAELTSKKFYNKMDELISMILNQQKVDFAYKIMI